ncbi:MAG: UxaA family hydrolase [Oscillospiraceae bacterium]|nr:UxaA family hydrolase [Oscillospiraceae bacterium]
MNAYVHASEKDNLVTCVKALKAGDTVAVDGKEITVLDDIPIYHKLAVAEIRKGEAVYKYGEVMGVASRDIHVGQWAHIHNIESTRGRGDRAGKEHDA